MSNNNNNTTASATSNPALPSRPTSLNSVAPTTSYSPYGGGAYNSYGSYGGGYGSMGGYGGYGSMGYGGFGSMGYSSPYSRYGGGGMYGMGGMGSMGGYGMNGGAQDPNGLQQSTAATFQMIESIVGAVGGFAQMLESTYMATHSSFFAMMSVAEQFGHLKNSLGSILGIFAIMRWARRLLAKLTGRAPPADAGAITAADFAKFTANGGPNGQKQPRPSFKPLLFFLAAVFGLPYLLGKLIRAMASTQENRLLAEGGAAEVDPKSLEFCRALFDFVPENPQIELELRKGDLVAVLSKQDPLGNPSDWWKVRTRDGRSGYVPSNYVEVIPRRIQEVKQVEDNHNNNISVEEFQKSAFNSH